jgi:hypothetical protein
VRGQKSAPPLGASTQFDRKRNFGRPSFIREDRDQRTESEGKGKRTEGREHKGEEGRMGLNFLLNNILEHEYPAHFFFGIDKRLQIFCQTSEIELSAPKKQFVP